MSNNQQQCCQLSDHIGLFANGKVVIYLTFFRVQFHAKKKNQLGRVRDTDQKQYSSQTRMEMTPFLTSLFPKLLLELHSVDESY